MWLYRKPWAGHPPSARDTASIASDHLERRPRDLEPVADPGALVADLPLEGRRVRKEGRMVLLTRGYQDLVKTVDSLLLEMRATGELRSAANPQAIRSGLMGMFEGLLRDQLLARRVDYPAAYTTEEIRKLFANVLGAL